MINLQTFCFSNLILAMWDWVLLFLPPDKLVLEGGRNQNLQGSTRNLPGIRFPGLRFLRIICNWLGSWIYAFFILPGWTRSPALTSGCKKFMSLHRKFLVQNKKFLVIIFVGIIRFKNATKISLLASMLYSHGWWNIVYFNFLTSNFLVRPRNKAGSSW
jgi:hypothetical protein